jgi:UPF0716 protein FxsA
MRIPISTLILLLVLAEVAVYVLVGSLIGVLPTLALGLISTVAGAILLRRQGLSAAMRMRAEIAAGRAPAGPLLETAVIAVAALLMVAPGFLTDIAGLLLFIPAVRGALGRWVVRRIAAAGRQAGFRPAGTPVIELGRHDYAAAPRRESPWRGDGDRGG